MNNNMLEIDYEEKTIQWFLSSLDNYEELQDSFIKKGFILDDRTKNSTQYKIFKKTATEFELKATQLYIISTQLRTKLEYKKSLDTEYEKLLKEFNTFRNKNFSYFRVLSEKNKIIHQQKELEPFLNLTIKELISSDVLNIKLNTCDDGLYNLENIFYNYENILSFFKQVNIEKLKDIKLEEITLNTQQGDTSKQMIAVLKFQRYFAIQRLSSLNLAWEEIR